MQPLPHSRVEMETSLTTVVLKIKEMRTCAHISFHIFSCPKGAQIKDIQCLS